jgi:hypothetical protein
VPRKEWKEGEGESSCVDKEVLSTEGFFSSMMLVLRGLGALAGLG